MGSGFQGGLRTAPDSGFGTSPRLAVVFAASSAPRPCRPVPVNECKPPAQRLAARHCRGRAPLRLGWAPLARRLSRFVSPSGVCLFGDCLTSRGIKRNPRPPGLSLPSPHRLANPPSLRPSPLAAYLQGAGRRAQRAERESAPAARRSRTVRRPRPMRAALRCCPTARRTAGRGPGRPFLSVGYRGKRARGRDGTGMGQALPLSSVGYRGKRARRATCAGTYGTGTAPFFLSGTEASEPDMQLVQAPMGQAPPLSSVGYRGKRARGRDSGAAAEPASSPAPSPTKARGQVASASHPPKGSDPALWPAPRLRRRAHGAARFRGTPLMISASESFLPPGWGGCLWRQKTPLVPPGP